MSVLLFILKVFGIAVLVLLFTVVLLLLLVLLVPFRYSAQGGKQPAAWEGKFRISWFMRLFELQAEQKEKQSEVSCRILWIKKDISEILLKKGSASDEKTGKENSRKQKKKKQSGGKNLRTKEAGESFVDRINDRWQEFKEKIPGRIEALEKKIRDLQMMLRFIQNEQTKEAVSCVMRRGGKAIRHILPVKCCGRLKFGLETPDQTGRVLAVLSMASPILKDHFLLEPDFDEKILEGNGAFSGRIRLGYLLVQTSCVVLNKNVRITYKRIRKLKERKEHDREQNE